MNFIGVGFFVIFLDYNKYFIQIWSYALSAVATGCSSPHCKECQTRHSIHRQISYTVECREVNILFKSYSTLCDTRLE